ncbi:hypothetical protein AeNC1_005672, partial [Aphanomyces euteiches]
MDIWTRYGHWSGVVYLIFTLGCSIGYLFLLAEVTTNDYWWREFNSTGGQTFLADVFNARTNFGQLGDFDLMAAVLRKNYSGSKTSIDLRPVITRRLLLSPIPLDVAVKTIRANTLYENIYTVVPYCWVDLKRRFEIAHTVQRQRRCESNKQENAAVYLETLLRNVETKDLTQSSFGIQLNQTILTPLLLLNEGPEWVKALKSLTRLSLEDEVALWQQYGLMHYKIEYQNRFMYGLDNSITVVNALGVVQSMKVHSSSYWDLSTARWTVRILYWGLWNDMTTCITLGCSLLRKSNNSLQALVGNQDTIFTSGSTSAAGDLMRASVGPFGRWDIHYIVPPRILLRIVAQFQSHFYRLMDLTPSLGLLYESIEDLDIDVVPPAWKGPGMIYFGGNFACACLSSSTPYPQTQFSFDGTCQEQTRFSIHFDPTSVLFATLMSNIALNEISSLCSSSSSLANVCSASIVAALEMTPAMLPLPINSTDVQTAVELVKTLNVNFYQMASRNTSMTLLKQAILSNDAWSFFGWIALYDWVDGTREVLNFEGDNGNITIMSARTALISMAANSLELPESACLYFWGAALYVTGLSIVVSSLLLVYGTRHHSYSDGHNLFYFNRVFGSAWVGRPFCFIRGITAVLILSTSSATLASTNNITSFVNYQRHWIAKLVLTGETLWLSYALNDIFLPLTGEIS